MKANPVAACAAAWCLAVSLAGCAPAIEADVGADAPYRETTVPLPDGAEQVFDM